jgi:hypothetical protein
LPPPGWYGTTILIVLVVWDHALWLDIASIVTAVMAAASRANG